MKTSLITLLAIGTLFTSCTADYTCSCEATDSSLNAEYTENLSRSDAEAWCDGWQTTGAATAGWTCTLTN